MTDNHSPSYMHRPDSSNLYLTLFLSERSMADRKQEKKTPPLRHTRSGSSPSETSEQTAVVSPTTPQSAEAPDDRVCTDCPASEHLPTCVQKQSLRDSAPPLNTRVKPTRLGAGGTPRASTIQEAEEEWRRRSVISNNNKSLEGGYDYRG